jgi:proteasome inhibitor subunit 1 (PI31)
MFMGTDHPLFRERFGNDGGVGGNGGAGGGRLWGGDGWLPQGAVPPGARFDPVGPGVRPSLAPRLSRIDTDCSLSFGG